ncbi:GatB/YqeY domain-containing protein [Microvirga sp. 3-52]|nr:GatB/YqeY domain-containing protein [Microvirga sp. 3-52]
MLAARGILVSHETVRRWAEKFGWEFANRICRRTPRPLKDKDIKARGAGKEPLSDEEILALLQKMVKQRQESITMYEQGGRAELTQAEKDEVTVISSYLPQQMDEAETKAAIQAAIAETGAASMKDMGKVVAALRGMYVGRMDFAKASGLVKDMVRKG